MLSHIAIHIVNITCHRDIRTDQNAQLKAWHVSDKVSLLNYGAT